MITWVKKLLWVVRNFESLQAKAASTIRFKEGYTEFTNSTLPPSDPPKWYLGRETLFEAKGDGYFISYDLVDHYIHSASRFCMMVCSRCLPSEARRA